MRWGDSDSSDEDEIPVSSLPPRRSSSVDEEEEEPPPRRPAPGPSAQSRNRDPRGSDSGFSGPPNKNKSRKNTGKGQRGGPPPQDWRAMAKSASRYSASSEGQGASKQVDGGAWMEQRRKKSLEQEEQRRRASEASLKEEQEKKRERRKSQMDALKAAVKEIEAVKESEATSSLQAAVAKGTEPHDARQKPAPTRILARPDPPPPPQPPQQQAKHEEDDAHSVQSSSTASSRGGRHHRGGGRDKDGRGRSGRGGGGGRDNSKRRTSRGEGRHEHGGRRSGRSEAGHGRGDSRSRGLQERNSPSGSQGNNSGGRGTASRGGKGGRRSHGRGKSSAAGRVHVGSTSVVRTSSGNVEYRISLDKEQDKTKGELLPNGTVRLSKKKHAKSTGGKGRDDSKSTSLQTKLEIGAKGK